jgi:sugar (pentulose or hexulose) kinase
VSRRRSSLLAALLALLAAFPLDVPAEDACLSDANRLCGATPPGDGRVYFCLRSSWNNLSQGCKDLLNWAQQRSNEIALDCQGDAFAYCQGVPVGQGRLYACLAGHHDQISSECKKAMALVKWFRESCSADRARLCPQIPLGDGGVLACLVSRRDALSPSCQAVFWPAQ